MTILGKDVSHWQATTPSLGGLGFLFARATVGNATDDRFKQHIANAHRAGLVTGAYHFAYHNGIESQAKTFLQVVLDTPVDFYFIDVEGPNRPTQAEVRTFINLMHQAGLKCGLYHSASGYFDAGQDYDWIAQWGPSAPTRHWDFWQYRGSPGDLDRFNGTLAQLHALAGIPTGPDTSTGGDMTPLPITDQMPKLVSTTAPMTFYNLDGTVQSEGHGALTDVLSPYQANNGTSSFRAIYARRADGTSDLILTKPTVVKPLPVVVPAPGYTQAQMDAAVAAARSGATGAEQARVKAVLGLK